MESNPEYSLEGLMKLQYFGHLMWRADSLEKTLMLGKINGKRRRGWQRMRWLGGITDWMDMSLSKLQDIVKEREAWRAIVHGVSLKESDLTWQLNNKKSLWALHKGLFHSSILGQFSVHAWHMVGSKQLFSRMTKRQQKLWLAADDIIGIPEIY